MGSRVVSTDSESACLHIAPLANISGRLGIADLYPGVVADALAGYRRLSGCDATSINLLFQVESRTGEPVTAFEECCDALGLTGRGVNWPDVGQRTDDDLWHAWQDNDDLYVGRFVGWHCNACGRFYADHEIQDGPSCPIHLCSVVKVDTDCWFFRLSRHRDRLRTYYDAVETELGRSLVTPGSRMDEIRTCLAEGLADIPLCAARLSIGQLVSGPDPLLPAWVSLIGMASAWRNCRETAAGTQTVYIVPDELVWSCAVAWSAMLLAAGRPAPARVIAHGLLPHGDGRRSQDWLRIAPGKVADALGVEALRYLLLRWPTIAADRDVSSETLIDCYSAELSNGLGNLVARTTAMAAKSELAGVVRRPEPAEYPFETEFDRYLSLDVPAVERVLDAVTKLVRAGNAFLEERQPWRQEVPERAHTLWHALELCRVIAHLIEPVLPECSRRILRQLGVAEPAHRPTWGSYNEAFRVSPDAEPLFRAITGSRRRRLLATWIAEAEKVSPQVQIGAHDFGQLDLRVARIADVERVSSAPGTVLRLKLDLGDEERVVFSTRFAQAFTPESLADRMVVYLANFPEVEIAGFTSKGMVLAVQDRQAISLLAFDQVHQPGTVMF